MNPYIQLAKKAVEKYILEGKIINPSPDLPKEMIEKRAGTFVTIKKGNRLRGCIGTYLPTQENIAKEIIQNAISAATEDYRFEQIKPEELPFLNYSVYILSEPKQIQNISELDPKKYGILIKTLSSPLKSALLLPDLEGIETPEQQIAICCQKGGIDPYNEKIIIYKFSAKKYENKK